MTTDKCTIFEYGNCYVSEQSILSFKLLNVKFSVVFQQDILTAYACTLTSVPFCFECLTEKLFNRYPSCQSMPFVMLQQAAQTLQTILHPGETSTGNYCLKCFKAYIGHLHFLTSGLLYFCKIGLC